MRLFKRTVLFVVLAFAVMIMVGSTAMAKEHSKGKPWHKPGGKLGAHLVDPIRTDAGWISGTTIDIIRFSATNLYGDPVEATIGEIGEDVRVYRGIPYAAPPVGDLRWKPPQPVTPWEGIRECTHFSPMAPQSFPASIVYGGIPEEGMSEDCLYLNVITPAKNANDRLPVMVWFHGGGITTGSSNPVTYNSGPLPNNGVVVVTVQHRIGPIGFLAHPLLSEESQDESEIYTSGNYGQLDLIAALKWVESNIAAFGGDPKCVTIFGHSGGGTKVLWLLSSPLARGLFQRAIVQSGCTISGPGVNPYSYCLDLDDAEAKGDSFMDSLGATTLEEMRALTWQEIILGASEYRYNTQFTVDGWSLPKSIYNTFAAGEQNDVPFMIGGAEGEAAKHTGIQAWADVLLSGKSNMYVYLFSHVPSNWKEKGVVAWHGDEVSYEFGTQGVLPLLVGVLIRDPDGDSSDLGPPGFDYKDEYVNEAWMKIVTKFAATGRPSVKRLVNLPPFGLGAGKDYYIDVGFPLKVQSGYMDLYQP